MPSNDAFQNSPHLEPRRAVRAGSHPPRIGQHETSSAIALEQHIRDGDLGAVRKFLHEAEYQLGVWRPNPWALLEHLVALAIARQSGVSGEREAEQAPETPEPVGGSTAG